MTPDIPTLKLQLQQLALQRDAGTLTPAQFEEKKRPLERQLLDRVLESGDVPAPARPVPAIAVSRLPAGLLASVVAVVVGIAAAGYAWKGSPGSASAPPPALAQAGAGENAAAGGPASDEVMAKQIEALTDKLTAHLKSKPDDVDGWVMLARTYMALGRLAESLPAYERAIALRGDDAQLMADYADSLAVNNNRVLAGEPMKWINKALKIDPRNVKALGLAGADAFDRKDYGAAVSYWEQVLQFGPTEGEYLEQVKASLAEARQLGGLSTGSPKPAEALKPAQPPVDLAGKAPVTPSGSAPLSTPVSASVSGTVSLSPALAKQAGPEDTLFVFARGPEGKGMPLAILRRQVKDLPLQFTLDDSLAMSPAAKISGVSSVVVSARISKTGEAFPQAGDLSGQTGPVKLGASSLKVEISDVVKP
jgi:cytochrome c-type biogenesis protein CcmH